MNIEDLIVEYGLDAEQAKRVHKWLEDYETDPLFCAFVNSFTISAIFSRAKRGNVQ